jgi:hypothetical protein
MMMLLHVDGIYTYKNARRRTIAWHLWHLGRTLLSCTLTVEEGEGDQTNTFSHLLASSRGIHRCNYHPRETASRMDRDVACRAP